MFPPWTKHIRVKFHYFKEVVESSEVTILKVRTYDNATNSLTKVVDGREVVDVGARWGFNLG
jgi:hypothetical protein